MKKFGKKLLTFIMTFAMVAGAWGVMKLDVRAKDMIADNIQPGDIVKAGDNIIFPKPVNGAKNVISLHFSENGVVGASVDLYSYVAMDKLVRTVPTLEVSNKTYQFFKIVNYRVTERDDGGKEYYIEGFATDEYMEETALTGKSKQSTSNSHSCNFQWITTIDPTTGADGLEEYKCAGCGLVKESHPIPASVAIIKDFYGKIKEAPENGSITYDSGKLYTISDYLLKKMAERNDVTVTVNFEYQNAKYELTFPAGTDYSTVLTDEETMYGYFGVAAKLGLKVVAK